MTGQKVESLGYFRSVGGKQELTKFFHPIPLAKWPLETCPHVIFKSNGRPVIKKGTHNMFFFGGEALRRRRWKKENLFTFL